MNIKSPTVNALWARANWKGQSHAAPNWKALPLFIPILAVPVLIIIFGATEIVLLISAAIAIVCVVPILKLAKANRWNNNKLIFAADDINIYFSMENSTADSWFEASYSELAGYQYTANDNATGTFIIKFTNTAYAGSFGNIKELKMIKVDHPNGLKQILDQKGVPHV